MILPVFQFCFSRWNNCAEARAHQSINLSCSWWGILCRRRDMEYWFLHTMYMPQRTCPVWDWSLSTAALSKPHPHTGLLLSTVPRYILTTTFHQSPFLIWKQMMWILKVSVCTRLLWCLCLAVWSESLQSSISTAKLDCVQEISYMERGVVALKFEHLWRQPNNVRVAWEPESLVGRFMKYALACLWKHAGLEKLRKQSKC